MNTDTDPTTMRDRDETRRLLYTAIVAIRSGRPVSAELAGTIVNAIVHHSKLVADAYAIELAVAIMRLDSNVTSILETMIGRLTDDA